MQNYLNKTSVWVVLVLFLQVFHLAPAASAREGLENGCVHIFDRCHDQEAGVTEYNFLVRYDDFSVLERLSGGNDKKCQFQPFTFRSSRACKDAQTTFPYCEWEKDNHGSYYVTPQGEFICYYIIN